jgi:hypothetical protein
VVLVAAGGLTFVLGAGVQYAAYTWVLRPGLRSGDAAARRRALGRWAAFVVGWQAVALVAIAVYALALPSGLRAGYAWVAPPLGLVLATGLTLQLALIALSRGVRA